MTVHGTGIFENDEAVMVLESLVDLSGNDPAYDITPDSVEQVVEVHEIPTTIEAVEAIVQEFGGISIETTAALLALAQVLLNAGAINAYPLIRDTALKAIEERSLDVIEQWDDWWSDLEGVERHEVEQSLGLLIKAVVPHLQVEDTEDATVVIH